MNKKDTRLPASLRKHIREKKAEIRNNHGKDSPKMAEFLDWVNKKRQEKLKRLKKQG